MKILPMSEVERRTILDAIAQLNDPCIVAKALGLGKTTIYRKLGLYGVSTRQTRRETPEVLASVPTPKYLVLPRSKAEEKEAQFKCPACHRAVLLPNKT